MKKLMNLLVLLVLVLGLTACQDPITIDVDEDHASGITLTEGDTFDIADYAIDTNDEEGLVYETLDQSVATVSGTIIEAVGEGTTTIVIRSVSDSNVSVEIPLTVRKLVTITTELTEINLTQEDVYDVVVTSNDGLTYESSNLDVFVVDDNGQITAKEVGEATLTITSTYDPDTTLEIPVTVGLLVELSVSTDDYILVVGDTMNLSVTTNDTVTYQSSQSTVISVSDSGAITALGFGTADVIITSETDPSKSVTVSFTVLKVTEELAITGDDVLVVDMTSQLEITASPVGAFEGVTWESLDDTIVSVDDNGVMTAHLVGTTTITATSTLDTSIIATFDVEVINVIVADSTAVSGSTYTYNGVELEFGSKLFATVTDALAAASSGTLVILDGSFEETVSIDHDGVTLTGIEGTTYHGVISIAADDITIEGLSFTGESMIQNSTSISNLTIMNNTADGLTNTTDAFILVSDITGLVITNNTFQNFTIEAIRINSIPDGTVEISHNVFFNVTLAIGIESNNDYAMTTELQLWWNDIDDVDMAFEIDMHYNGSMKAIEAIVRFNTVHDALTNAYSPSGSTVDYTLNFWGCVELDMAQFPNIDPYYLRGFYTVKEQVPSEQEYNPEYPVMILIDNPIEEIMIGETHTYEYSILPMEQSDHPVKFITGNPELVATNILGEITPLKSGIAYIQIRSAINSSIRVQDDFSIVTTPGIELTPSNVYNNVLVGDSFTLAAEPFPVAYEAESVSFVSDNPSVATIDGSGQVQALSEGLVTFTASLDSDPSVTQTFTTYVYGALDQTNPLDYLTMNQITYTTSHKWIAYGFAYNYNDWKYESVSRYYFDNIDINQDKMVPVSYGIRPGEPMDPLPVGVTKYNPENVHWVVIHDTANTATGAGALSHANYLYNGAMAGTELWVSWHFTIDHEEVYQHLPTNERGYHAGDGSTSPGEGTYLGGGNRNGIGIEMSVQDDGDTMRTWQRTAKLAVDLLLQYNLPRDHQKYHNDFSGKDCPNTLRNAGLIPLFEEFVDVEYHMATTFPGASITFTSNNPEFVDDHGRVIAMPERAMTVSYTITVDYNGQVQSRTFYSYLPGTVR